MTLLDQDSFSNAIGYFYLPFSLWFSFSCSVNEHLGWRGGT